MNLLTTRQFADFLRVTPETVRRWVREKKLVPWGRTPTGQLRFHADQVEEFNKQGPIVGDRAQAIALQVAADTRREIRGRFGRGQQVSRGG